MSGHQLSEAEIRALFAGVAFEQELKRCGLLDEAPGESEPPARKTRPAPGDLAARRSAGRAAYERAFAERGLPVPYVRSAIYASAVPWLYGEEATGGR